MVAYRSRRSSEYRLRQLVYLFFAALGLAERPAPRGCRMSGFEVLATYENQQQKNEQGIDFHCSPRSVVINLVAMTRGRLQGFFFGSSGNNDYAESRNVSLSRC
jgi:hypothetical protein